MSENNNLLQLIAEETVKSSLISSSIASKLAKDPVFIGRIVETIDPDVMARHLANSILFMAKQRNSGTHTADTASAIMETLLRELGWKTATQIREEVMREISVS